MSLPFALSVSWFHFLCLFLGVCIKALPSPLPALRKLVLCSVLLIFSILLHIHISKASSRLSVSSYSCLVFLSEVCSSLRMFSYHYPSLKSPCGIWPQL